MQMNLKAKSALSFQYLGENTLIKSNMLSCTRECSAVIHSLWLPPNDHQGDQHIEMQKQDLLCSQYQSAGTLPVQPQQQQEEVTHPSVGHYCEYIP